MHCMVALLYKSLQVWNVLEEYYCAIQLIKQYNTEGYAHKIAKFWILQRKSLNFESSYQRLVKMPRVVLN